MNRAITLSLLCAVLLSAGACATIHAPDDAVSTARPEPAIAPGTPLRAEIYLGIVDGLIRQERYRAALAFLDQYAAVGAPATPQFLLLRGKALLGGGEDDAAQAAFARLTATPYAGEALNGQGRAEAALGRWGTAEAYLTKAVTEKPARADFLNNLAYVKLRSGNARANDAAADLRAAHELDPKSDTIRNNLILALTVAGRHSEADEILASIRDVHERETVAAFAARGGTQDSSARSPSSLRAGFGD